MSSQKSQRRNEMADKWEMCVLISTTGDVTINTASRSWTVKRKELTKRYGLSGIQYILSNGWEPYAAVNGAFYFRRKSNP